MHGLPQGGVVIASGDDFGVKLFSAKEIEAAVRHGVALEPDQSSPWDGGCVGVHIPNLFVFRIDLL